MLQDWNLSKAETPKLTSMNCQAVSQEKCCALSATSLWNCFFFLVWTSVWPWFQSIVSSKHTAGMNLLLVFSPCHLHWLPCPCGISSRIPSTSVHHPSLTSCHGSACSVSSPVQPQMSGTRALRNTRPGRAVDVKPLQLVTVAVGSPRDTCYKEPGRQRRKAALLKFLDLFLPKSPRHNRSPEFFSRDTTLSQAWKTRLFLK